MTERVRAYIDEDVHLRVKKYAAKKGISVVEAYRRIVYSMIDPDGNEQGIVLDPETLDLVDSIARAMGVDRSEAIRLMAITIRVLFDPRLSLSIALRPIPELARILGIKIKGIKTGLSSKK